MPLVNVKDLVTHANRHGYLVASFTVHSAETIQAVVTAAEANRAPVILAVEIPSATFIHYEIMLTVAEAVARRAAVPIAIEARCGRGATSLPKLANSISSLAFAPDTDPDAQRPFSGPRAMAVDRTCERWIATTADVSPVPEAVDDIDYVGVSVQRPEAGQRLRPSLVRTQCSRLRASCDKPLVVAGDIDWPDPLFSSFPEIGVAKINYGSRLSDIILKTNKTIVKRAADDYWESIEYIFAALIEDITCSLRRAKSTGRAADVLACTTIIENEASREQANDDKYPLAGSRFHHGGFATTRFNSTSDMATTLARFAYSE